MDDGKIDRFRHCEKLTEVRIPALALRPNTLIAVMYFCPQLSFVEVDTISTIDNAEVALATLKSFSDIPKRSIRLKFSSWNQVEYNSLWTSRRAKKVLKKLEQNGGPLIHIEFRGRCSLICTNDPPYFPINFMV